MMDGTLDGCSGGARSIGGLVWFGLVWRLSWLGLGLLAGRRWRWRLELALVWLVDRDHGHARGSRRSELTII